jgi:hypothetical protein
MPTTLRTARSWKRLWRLVNATNHPLAYGLLWQLTQVWKRIPREPGEQHPVQE